MINQPFITHNVDARPERPAPARFLWRAVQNDQASAEAGRPIYEDVPFIEKWTPGDPTSIPCRPVRESDKYEYPQEWAAFEAKKEQKVSGTPLEELPFLTEAQRLELKAVRINTVEDLANVPDATGQRFMGFHGMKNRARAYLEAAAGNAPLVKMQAELEQRDQQIALLMSQLKELGDTVSELRKGKK